MMTIAEQLYSYVDEYKDFIGTSLFPSFNLQSRTASISTADSQGFEVVAASNYQLATRQHTLTVSTNIALTKYVVFHEFTHMLDTELHTNGDKMRYLGLSGYTEYHASQVELAQLLGCKAINSIEPFSMSTRVTTITGPKSVFQYVQEKQQHAIELFSRSDFPASVNTLKSAFGVLYNYWGLRSICEMYSTDYEERIDNSAFLRHIPSTYFILLNRLMHGWLDNEKINKSIPLYANTIIPIIQNYKLL